MKYMEEVKQPFIDPLSSEFCKEYGFTDKKKQITNEIVPITSGKRERNSFASILLAVETPINSSILVPKINKTT